MATRNTDIVVHRSGLIHVNRRLREILCLSPGDAVNVAADGIERVIYVTHRAFERCNCSGTLCASKPPNRHLRFFSVRCARLLLPKDAVRASFFVGERISDKSRVATNIITRIPLDVQFPR